MRSLYLLILFFCTPTLITAGRVLFLVPFNGPSHWIFLSHFIRELLEREHHVTAITGIKYAGEMHVNYTEILIDPPYPLDVEVSKDEIFNVKYSSPYVIIKWLYGLGLLTSEHGLKNSNVQKFINSENNSFDVIVSEQFYQETWLMFAHKFNAPIVTVSTMGYSDYMDYANGLITPWSYVPHMLLNYDDKMSFWQRCENVIISLYDKYVRYTWYMPKNNELAEKYFSSLKKRGPLPQVQDLERSISIILANIHNANTKPRPQMPNQINIGGAHVKPSTKPLPSDIKKFLDEATNGVIYMSLGAFVQSSQMPKHKATQILNAFSKLKQKVLWKWESDSSPELPKNVMIKKWMPQADILAHENVKLFITHGGMFGTTEATYHGVPMLYMPFYGDQHRNALKAEAAGVALRIQFNDITTETLGAKLNELLNNPKYYQKAKEISKVFKDVPMHPMNTSIFYIEYVMRHKGANCLKSAAIEMTWYQNLLLDVYGFFLLSLIGTIYCIKRTLCAVFSKRQEVKQKMS